MVNSYYETWARGEQMQRPKLTAVDTTVARELFVESRRGAKALQREINRIKRH